MAISLGACLTIGTAKASSIAYAEPDLRLAAMISLSCTGAAYVLRHVTLAETSTKSGTSMDLPIASRCRTSRAARMSHSAGLGGPAGMAAAKVARAAQANLGSLKSVAARSKK